MHLNKISSKEYKAVMKSYPTSLMGAVAAHHFGHFCSSLDAVAALDPPVAILGYSYPTNLFHNLTTV